MRSGRFDQLASGLPKWSMISFSPRWRSAIGPMACSRSGPSSAIGSPARSAAGQSQSIVPSDNQVFWCGCSSAKRSPSTELSALAEEERIGANHESARAQSGHACEGDVEVLLGAGFQYMKLQPAAAGRGL